MNGRARRRRRLEAVDWRKVAACPAHRRRSWLELKAKLARKPRLGTLVGGTLLGDWRYSR